MRETPETRQELVASSLGGENVDALQAEGEPCAEKPSPTASFQLLVFSRAWENTAIGSFFINKHS